jgi:hypothetical protein
MRWNAPTISYNRRPAHVHCFEQVVDQPHMSPLMLTGWAIRQPWIGYLRLQNSHAYRFQHVVGSTSM